MQDDLIRAALREAGRAIARSLHEAGLPAALGEDQWHAEAAAAIAAFLRALPDVMQLEARAKYNSTVFVSGTRERLAAAVERAALEQNSNE